MLSISNALKKESVSGVAAPACKVKIKLKSGKELVLTQSDLWEGGFSMDDATSGSGSFDIGQVITNRLKLNLDDSEEQYSVYDFLDAEATAWRGGILQDGTTELLQCGSFLVQEQSNPDSSVDLTCLDNMCRTEIPYSEVSTVYPATIQVIVQDICSRCGITLATTQIDNGGYVVSERPNDEALTCRDVLHYAAQISGSFARCDALGRMELRWYNEKATKHKITAIKSFTPENQDIIITGIQATDASDEKQSSLYGEKGYVLEVSDNPLIEAGKAPVVASYLGKKIIGMSFRPLDLTCILDPSAEAGDPAEVTDRKGKTYTCWITNMTYATGRDTKITCDAESPSDRAAVRFSEQTKAIIENRNKIEKERTERELALKNLSKQLAESSGMYITSEKQEDGSTIYYAHDKPKLDESQIVWKMTATAIGISADGGKTYPYGLDVSGRAILDRIYVIGINAENVKVESKKLTECIEEISSKASDASAAAKSATDATNAAVASVEVEYYKSTSPTQLTGGKWQPATPTWAEGSYIWSRTKTTTKGGIVAYSTPVCITGNTGANGEQGASLITVITEYSYNKTELAAYSKDGYSGTWKVKNTEGIKVGDTVLLRVYNTTTKSYSFVVAKVTAVNTTSSRVTCTSMGLIEKGEDGAQGIQGIQGPKGDQGIPGADGTNGKSSYFHIAYANSADGKVDFSVGVASGRAYIGTYVDYTPTDSTDYTKYTWQLVKGAQGAKGDQGIPGTNGVNGKTSYLHIAYANSADGKNGFDVSDGTGKLYIGQYTDYTQADSINPAKYTWSKIKGETGRGVKTIVSQYYLSTSSTKQEGGSWNTTQPAWADGKYIWTRSYIIWDDGTTSTTTPVLASALNGLGQDLSEVKKTVTKQGASLKVVENQIQEKVWKEDITTEIKNLRIGGRNYAQNSESLRLVPNGTDNYDLEIPLYKPQVWDAVKKSGYTYTVSFDLQAESALSADYTTQVWIRQPPWYSAGSITYPAGTTAKKHYSLTATAKDDTLKTNLFMRFMKKDTVAMVLSKIKVEAGDHETDWTLAPEEIDAGIDQAQSTADRASTTITTVTTQVESLKTATEALSKAMQSYVKEDDLETYKKQVESQLSQTPDAIEARFKTIEQNVSKVGSSSDDRWAQLETYIRLTQNGIALGKSDSPITLEIRNDRICFMQSGQVVAYYTNNQLYNSNLVVTTTANILGLVITKSGRHLRIS